MKLKIRYFGMLAEITNMEFECIEVDENIGAFMLKDLLEEKYNQFSKINYKVAVNENIIETDMNLNMDSEIALLPPFAGG